MGQQIIKQPNGKYCLFSSVIDNVTHYDMTKEEIVKVWTQEAKIGFEKKVNDIASKLDKGEKPYFQFTLSYEEMLQKILEVHNADEMQNVKNTIECK
jgi:alpha-glucosidase (family GH31 glycosyl hydrolase)